MVAEVLFYPQKMKSLGGPLPSTDRGNDLKYTEFHSMILDILNSHCPFKCYIRYCNHCKNPRHTESHMVVRIGFKLEPNIGKFGLCSGVLHLFQHGGC